MTDHIRSWLFRSLMFESEAESFRDAGIRVGTDEREAEQSLLDETLSPFPLNLRNSARRMARIYALLFAFENSVRDLINDRLGEDNIDWWSDDSMVPKSLKKSATSRFNDAEKNSWLDGENGTILGFIDFGDLSSIILHNWSAFEDLIPSQHWLKQRMDELEKARNFIAHNRLLSASEFARIEMYVKDWNRQVGL